MPFCTDLPLGCASLERSSQDFTRQAPPLYGRPRYTLSTYARRYRSLEIPPHSLCSGRARTAVLGLAKRSWKLEPPRTTVTPETLPYPISILLPAADFPADAPTAPSDIKLICNGKFLSGIETLNGMDIRTLNASSAQAIPHQCPQDGVFAELRALMGDPRTDQIMTLHLVIRPQAAVKSSGGPCAFAV